MKKRKFRRIAVVLLTEFMIVIPFVMQTKANELVIDDVISGDCIRAGVASLFFVNDEIEMMDSSDIETEIENDIITDVLIDENKSILEEDIALINDEISEDISLINSNESDNDLSDSHKEEKTEDDETKKNEADMSDVIKTARAVEGTIVLTKDEEIALDVNKNGTVDMGDVVMLARSVSGSISE